MQNVDVTSEGIYLFCLLIMALPRLVFRLFSVIMVRHSLAFETFESLTKKLPDGNGAISNSSPFRARLHNVHITVRKHMFTDLVIS